MERKIGELFEFKGKIYKVVESETVACPSCAFKGWCVDSDKVSGPCAGRTDKKFVVFKEINMKIRDNKLTIDIPEGMEIDILNSNFGTGLSSSRRKS